MIASKILRSSVGAEVPPKYSKWSEGRAEAGRRQEEENMLMSFNA